MPKLTPTQAILALVALAGPEALSILDKREPLKPCPRCGRIICTEGHPEAEARKGKTDGR